MDELTLAEKLAFIPMILLIVIALWIEAKEEK